jgi:DNA repair protein RecO
MNQIVTTAIILRRTDFGEADRILTLLTPDHGKLRLMAKGVRRPKSKLAGGIELFSVSKISFIRGRGEIGTLISAQLNTHYGTIVKDINRTMLGYDLIKQLDKTTEDETDADYFELLQQAFVALDTPNIAVELIRMWFGVQLLRLGGHMPNLLTDMSGNKLQPNERYIFVYDDMTMAERPDGPFTADHIKFLRLAFGGAQPKLLSQVQGSEKLIADCIPLVQTMAADYIA